MQDSFLRKSFTRDVVLMKTVGINPVMFMEEGPKLEKNWIDISLLSNSKME